MPISGSGFKKPVAKGSGLKALFMESSYGIYVHRPLAPLGNMANANLREWIKGLVYGVLIWNLCSPPLGSFW